MRTCVRVSIKGHPYRWFATALKRRDLAGAKAAAAELDHVTLTDALSIVVLMAECGDRALDRAAARWLARLVAEHRAVGLGELRHALTALESLARDADDAHPSRMSAPASGSRAWWACRATSEECVTRAWLRSGSRRSAEQPPLGRSQPGGRGRMVRACHPIGGD